MSQALDTWREKLAYLQQQEAIATDPAQKFGLAKEIDEAKVKIGELETAAGSLRHLAPRAFHADISRIIKYAPVELVGRDDELKFLNDAWNKVRAGESPCPNVITFVALGGEGKTSLVAKWAADLAQQEWPGCDAVFAWSFYHQGTDEKTADSSDAFLKEALTTFGDPAMAGSGQHASDKGRRLAQLVGQQRALLILDGVEPLQYAPTAPNPGELKDQGLAALLKELAATNRGLCVVTTRYSLPDLRAYLQSTAPEVKLLRLSKRAGVVLLRSLEVLGTPREFEDLVEAVSGHALTLNLLGSYLRDAHAGDIRKRDLVRLEEANAEEQGGHAFRAMDAYVQWFETEGEKGKRALAVLRLLSLFDRPVSADCLAALLKAPAIQGLTEALVGLSQTQRNVTFSRLEVARLLTVNRDRAGQLLSLDAHPLLRAYFAGHLRTNQPEAWCDAHRRLYEHLCATTTDQPQADLEDLQPLYQAVAHGCQAGLYQEACDEVYFSRLQRGEERYSTFRLGALGSDLGAIACFFEQLWSRLAPSIAENDQAWLLNEAAFTLRALGRLTEALEPMRTGMELKARAGSWLNAAIGASNLSGLNLTLGNLAEAIEDAELSITYADRSGDRVQMAGVRTTHADALHHAGHRADAEARYREAEALQIKWRPDFPLLYSVPGFRYCDLLLSDAERAAWQSMLGEGTRPGNGPDGRASLIQSCRAVSERSTQTLRWVTTQDWLLDIALDNLTLGRAALYEAILSVSSFGRCHVSLEQAMSALRRSGEQPHLPRGLITRAWMRYVDGNRTGYESAQSDLDDAWEIAERGPMPVFMADIHLHRARLFFREAQYPWESPQADLAAAREVIERCGYGRREGELEEAERIILKL